MKRIIIFMLILLNGALNSIAQTKSDIYDKALADSLGADEYGMKQYTFVILKTGTNTTESKESTDSLFRGHMNNIGRLAKEGKLIVAGPFVKNEKAYRGLFILNVKTMEEAKNLLSTDPAINAHLLESNFSHGMALQHYPCTLTIIQRLKATHTELHNSEKQQ